MNNEEVLGKFPNIYKKKTLKLKNGTEDIPNSYDPKPTYKEYRGSYAQDIAGFSDQEIRDAFGGEADVYWSID